ncbi:hypothetical protein [Christiangramia forsetii]|uniref:Uncharacterized protein n=2 Tax=Christiangramia forsetii TaxID=411153 RepID=A0M464_CHRFK|nr:hypothetical protein [Christiangramia forsetii]GGG24136.1 hypothetical protein GCM10011532_04210 [Christiangramia forsetii]CAL67409.1 hypothetical protein GFO_2453 [Christiangramia forsetii KT0803]
MKIKITKKFVDQETGKTILPKKTIERNKERGQAIINAGYGEEVKPKAKKSESDTKE